MGVGRLDRRGRSLWIVIGQFGKYLVRRWLAALDSFGRLGLICPKAMIIKAFVQSLSLDGLDIVVESRPVGDVPDFWPLATFVDLELFAQLVPTVVERLRRHVRAGCLE